MSKSIEQKVVDVIRQDGRYPLEAYVFLHEALSRAVRDAHGQESAGKPLHVTPRQVCLALRDEALESWGLLARTVLGRWRIHTTMDIGNMIFLLTDHKLWQKTPEDKLEDCRDVFDFDEAFGPADNPKGL